MRKLLSAKICFGSLVAPAAGSGGRLNSKTELKWRVHAARPAPAGFSGARRTHHLPSAGFVPYASETTREIAAEGASTDSSFLAFVLGSRILGMALLEEVKQHVRHHPASHEDRPVIGLVERRVWDADDPLFEIRRS
jgi:hypothetical protein